MSGILPDMPPHLELVDEDFVPSPLPGTPLYGPPVTIPVAGVAEYWQGVFERNDPAELERIAAAYATVTPSIGPAPDREETAPESAGAQLAPPSTEAPTASTPPSDDGEAA
jgi:hypothetical protein